MNVCALKQQIPAAEAIFHKKFKTRRRLFNFDFTGHHHNLSFFHLETKQKEIYCHVDFAIDVVVQGEKYDNQSPKRRYLLADYLFPAVL